MLIWTNSNSLAITYLIQVACFKRNLQSSWANNSRILKIKNAKFAGYCFYLNTNIKGDFQICISIPLR